MALPPPPLPPPIIPTPCTSLGLPANAVLGTQAELMRAIRRGRWMVKEMLAVSQLRKYRQLRQVCEGG